MKKIFLAVFSAIIAASIVIGICYAAMDHIASWENRKRDIVAAIAQNGRSYHAISEEAQGQGLEVLTYAIKTMGTLNEQRTEALEILHEHLRNKPFYVPLTAEEREMLNAIEKPSGSDQTEHASFVRLTTDARLDNRIVPAGTELRLMAREGNFVTVQYEGENYALPISQTDAR